MVSSHRRFVNNGPYAQRLPFAEIGDNKIGDDMAGNMPKTGCIRQDMIDYGETISTADMTCKIVPYYLITL